MDGFWLPKPGGLLNREAQVPFSRRDQIEQRVLYPAAPPVADRTVAQVPAGKAVAPAVTAELKRQQLFGSVFARLQQRYQSIPWTPTLSIQEGAALVDWIMRAELAKRGRVLSEHNVDVDLAFHLLLYFWRHRDCPFDLDRSILLYGPYGVGKTFLFRCFAILFAEIAPKPEQLTMLRSAEMMTEVQTKKSFAALDKYRTGPLIVDELGTESRTESVYGNKKDAFGDFLAGRYELFIDRRTKTHFTTNLLPKELGLENWYGDRLGDRYLEWMQPIKYNLTTSKRPVKKTVSNLAQ